MPDNLLIIIDSEMKESDRNFVKLSEFMGIKCSIFHLNDQSSNFDALIKPINSFDNCVALSSNTIHNIIQKYGYDQFENYLCEKISHILIYDLNPGEISRSVVSHLTDGTISSISTFEENNYQYIMSKNHPNICNEFSGISFGPINKKIDFKLDIGKNSNSLNSIVSVDGSPLFASYTKNSSEIFFLATDQILDIETEIEVIPNFKSCFSQLIPPIMFLKYVFGNKCWHNGNRYACLIIDDPLLRKQYGFLDYDTLLKCMDQNHFSSSIAFIPWNYKRTDNNVAKLFKTHPRKLSICVHGSDHTKGEFAIRDTHQLNAKIKSATTKMMAHEKSTGIKFDNVMVFPQGIFSVESMKVLKHNNFMAAVNTKIFPNETLENGDLKISNCLDLAVMNYDNFPLFVRNYPDDIVDFVFNMFLCKPIFIVIHHDHLRNGYKKLTEFISNLNTIRNDIQWGSLGDIIQNSYLKKEVSEETLHIKLYANNASIFNCYALTKKLLITKNEKSEVPIKNVFINGKPASYSDDNNLLTIHTFIAPKSIINVRIEYIEKESEMYIETKDFKENIKIFMRRYLSEFRDNYISKHDFLLKMTKKLLRS